MAECVNVHYWSHIAQVTVVVAFLCFRSFGGYDGLGFPFPHPGVPSSTPMPPGKEKACALVLLKQRLIAFLFFLTVGGEAAKKV